MLSQIILLFHDCKNLSKEINVVLRGFFVLKFSSIYIVCFFSVAFLLLLVLCSTFCVKRPISDVRI